MNEIDLNEQLKAKTSELEQQRAVVREQAEFIDIIYNRVREAVFVVDVEANRTFRYQSFNPAAIKLTGIADVVGKTPAQILPPEVAMQVERDYQRCVDARTSISYEECLPFENRNTWWLTTLNPVTDASGKIYKLVGTSLNINERKQAEIELNQEKIFIEILLNCLSDGIVACDATGTLALFNRASLDFFATPQEPVPPTEWAERYHLFDAAGKDYLKQEEIPLFRAFSGESFSNVELMAKPPNQKHRTLLANGSPIIDSEGNKLGAVVAVQDITQRKQAEQDLAQLNAELEQRVQKRTQELERIDSLLLATISTLEQRNQELDRFAYIVSHDLKAPLRAIANLSTWIEEDLADKMDEATRHHITLLRSRVHRLDKLINGLLAYSRVGRVDTQTQLVEVSQILRDIIDLLELPDNCRIEIQGEMPIFTTQIVPLQQVLSNLIGNAVKHNCDRPNQIVISVRDLEGFYEFAIADCGKGIAPEDRDRIFTIFQTLDTKERQENTGIGLSIVKKAVENQGGMITIESEVNVGTTFRFTWNKNDGS